MADNRCTLMVRSISNFFYGIRSIAKPRRILGLAVLAALYGPSACVVRAQGYLTSIGVPTFTTSVPVESGVVDLQNGNLRLSIPIGSFPQRGGHTLSFSFMYDSTVWQQVSSGWQPTNVPDANGGSSVGGWRLVPSMLGWSLSYDMSFWDDGYGGWYEDVSDYVLTTEDGTQHSFAVEWYWSCDDYGDCSGDSTVDGFAIDATGYEIFVNGSAYVIGPDGTTSNEDTNGNYYLPDSNGNIIDTLGRTPVTKSTCGSNTCYAVLNANGSNQIYTVKTTSVNVNTNFGQTGISEYSGSFMAISEIDLPDGTKYQFSYDDGTSSGHYGTLTSMTLPTGGAVNYGYTNFADAYGNHSMWIDSRAVSGTGITGGTWNYTPLVNTTCSTSTSVNCQQQVTVQKPSGDQTVCTFNLNGGPWTSQIQSYTGSASSGTLLATVTNSWNYTQGCPTYAYCGNPGAYWVLQTVKTTTLPIPGGSNLSQTTDYTWDTSGDGNPVEIDEYDFGGNVRTTTISYLNGSSYLNANIINRPTTVTVYNASSSIIAQTINSYDQGSLTSSTGRTQHDDYYHGTSNTVRGNLTQVQRLVSGSTYLSTSMTYDTLGNMLTSTDPKGNTTSYDYTDNFYDDPGDGSTPTGHSPSTPTNAYPKAISYPMSLTATLGHYWGTGQLALSEDANSNFTYYHFHEPLMRPTSTALPNSEWTRVTYNSTDTEMDLYTGTTNSSASTSCSVCRIDATLFDSLGRYHASVLESDPSGSIYVVKSYDSSGRVYYITNPFQSTSDPTYGADTFTSYDGLNRPLTIYRANGDPAYTYYGAAVGSGGGATSQGCSGYGAGYPILVVDEVGNKRQTWTDAFGRVIETDEPNASGTLNVATCYSYDANNNLTGVAGQSSQTRSYSYDLLSRVTATTTPETGTTNIYYTTSGSALCSGDPTAVCRRTDARSITTTYTYDALNRLTSKSYNDSSPTTPPVNYSYDQTSYNGLTITNGKGRRTGMSDGSGQTAWSYDSVGNVVAEERTINSQTKTINYGYNLDGSISTIQYPGSRTVTYTEANTQRMTAAADVSNNINYATAPSSGAMYAPTGAPANIVHGYVSGGFAGITEEYTYNNRLQVTVIEATSSGGTPLNLSYSYAQSSHDNGNMTTQTNNATSGRTQTYTYDTLNRLLSAQTAATSGGDCWGQSFGNNATPPTLAADALNNLLNINVTQCSAPGLSVTGSTSTNQFTTSGYSYDSAGNNTGDGLNSYTYDAENRIRSAGVGGTYYCYIYDGNGLRVEKATASGSACSSPTAYELYWRSISGDTIAETDGSGSTTNSSYNEYVFFAGRRIAQSNPSSSTVYYYFADHLGSTRVVTNATGTACYEADFLPYGYENTPASFSNTCSTNYKFTGYERDSETGLDYAFARHYNQRMGRFQSGDPLGGDITDPQTLNRYTYARNNPVNFIDPTGLFYGPGGGGDEGGNNGFCDNNPGDPICWGGGATYGYECDTCTYALPLPPPPQPAAPSGQALQAQTSTCTVSNGRTTAPAPGQAPGPGAFGFVPPAGSLAIDPMALGLFPGGQTNALLGPYASQITFSFSPAPNFPSGFPTTHTLGSVVGPASVRAGGSNFNGLYDFDIFGLPSLAAAYAATSPPGIAVNVTVTFPSSLPINCGGPLADPILPPPGEVPAFRRALKW